MVIELCNLFYDGHSHAHTTHMHEKRTLYGSEVGKKAFAQMSIGNETHYSIIVCAASCVSSPLPTIRFMHACKMLCEYGFGKSMVLYCPVRANHTEMLHLKRVLTLFVGNVVPFAPNNEYFKLCS